MRVAFIFLEYGGERVVAVVQRGVGGWGGETEIGWLCRIMLGGSMRGNAWEWVGEERLVFAMA